LAWTNQRLNIQYRKVEADFDHFSFDPRELPALLLAGHNRLRWSRKFAAAWRAISSMAA
jgi:hypothetical protein